MAGAARRWTREQEGRAWLAWHGEALNRVKKLPKFEAFAGVKARRAPVRQSVAEMRAMAARWHAALSAPIRP